MKNTDIYLRISFLLLVFAQTSCRKFVQVPVAKDQLLSADVFSNDATAKSTIAGIYSRMMLPGNSFAGGDYSSLSCLGGLSADELQGHSFNTANAQFFQNTLDGTNFINESNLWGQAYSAIYYANSIIEGVSSSSGISPGLKDQLLGEAAFVRAFCHFYLVNLYGDVPIVISSDYRVNAVSARSSKEKVYEQIIRDLENAQSLLSDGYSTGERVRPNRSAATALLARVWLYLGDWEKAEDQASAVIDDVALYHLLADLNEVFLKNSEEAIWQLMPVVSYRNTNEAANFILQGIPGTDLSKASTLSEAFLNAFEPNDHRRTAWVDSIIVESNVYYYPFKYKVNAAGPAVEYSMVLRLAEQYLIRAEARAHLNDVTGAHADLDAIRKRAGLAGSSAADQAALLLEIEQERRVELFTEWGHRWLDLKRTDRAIPVLTAAKGDIQQKDLLYPIPQSEIKNDPNLVQNPGY